MTSSVPRWAAMAQPTTPTSDVEHDGQNQEPGARLDLRDVGHPETIGSGDI
jgi:hypothetical protein